MIILAGTIDGVRMLLPVLGKEDVSFYSCSLQEVTKDGFPVLPGFSQKTIDGTKLIKNVDFTHTMLETDGCWLAYLENNMLVIHSDGLVDHTECVALMVS